MHFQYLVEDQSGAALIRILMQKNVELYPNATYDCKGFRGIGGFTRKNTIKETKTGKLLNDLATYLRGFDRSLQSFPSVIIVVLDSDDHDVQQFRSELEAVAMQNMIKIDHVFCLAVEEIEAWLLGDRHARLLDNSRFTAPQRAAFTKLEECFDLFPIFKTAKEQLEQIEKKLMFYTVTPEQENKAIDALKFKEELCGPHGVLLLGKLLDPNGNELEATDSTIIKLAQEQSEASLSYQDEIPWGVCRLLQLFQGTNYQDI